LGRVSVSRRSEAEGLDRYFTLRKPQRRQPLPHLVLDREAGSALGFSYMGIEEVEGEVSPVKPDQVVHHRVVEGSVQRAVPATAPGWFEQDMPYAVLVGQIDQLVKRAWGRHPDPATPFRPRQSLCLTPWQKSRASPANTAKQPLT
jgi:hypothetical protein